MPRWVKGPAKLGAGRRTVDGGYPTLELTNQPLLLCCSIGNLVRRSFTSWPRFSSSNLGRATPSCPCLSVCASACVCVCGVCQSVCNLSCVRVTSCCDLPSPRPYPQKGLISVVIPPRRRRRRRLCQPLPIEHLPTPFPRNSHPTRPTCCPLTTASSCSYASLA